MNHRRSIILLAVALVASAALGAPGASAAPPVPSDASEVVHWNEVATTTLAAFPGPSGGAPPAFQINMGMTQGAVYDAVNAIGPKRYQPYLLDRRFGAKASTDAAAATAAYDMLYELVDTAPPTPAFPARDTLKATLAAEYAESLAAVADGPFKRQGIAAGHAAADAMLAARADDGRFGPSPWTLNPLPGHWSPLIGANGLPALDPTPWAGNVTPFLIESQSQFRSAPPLALDSPAYAAEVNEVQMLGRATGSTRTDEQTWIARWWQSAPILSWNEVSRQLIERSGMSAGDSARLLALQNMSGADALINCWNDKYHYDFWRPWNAIQRADEDGNAATTAETGWTALITAPYPEAPSGHNCNDGAHVTILRMYFGDVIAGGFQITSFSGALQPGDPRVRTFASFSQPMAELIEARIWAGLHFRFADVQGQILGANVANYGAAHHFQAVGH
ncbi:vanadium-dependent haloperoxidase [Microbacterium sp. SS28]|uniref:vanadium-dependent haloperoxidase n=1 Tax=Microbacterium sp. SS28 TaxID=2919948 RepID=UPI001FAA4606|nr:vanadium-dependent haloperoxidase [Microbacterium sp. SS28]